MALANLLRALVSGGDPGSGGEGDPAELSVTGQRQPTGDDPQMAPPMSSADQFLQQPNPQMDAPQAPPQGASQDPTPPGINYNNSRQAGAVQDALGGEPPLRGGSANPGIYGVLPQHLQHGTLRNVLGALGDAFLVGSGRDAQYRPRMQQQEIGAAMAGYDPNDANSVQAAIQRVAATGAPGSAEMADRMQKNYQESLDRRAREAETSVYHSELSASRHDQALQRMTPYIGALVAGADSPEEYKQAYDRAEAIAQRIGSDYHASDFGLVDPADWTPARSVNAGMRANDIRQSSDRGFARGTSERNADVAAGSRVEAARIGAGSRVLGAQISAAKPTGSTMLQNIMDKQDAGHPLTGSEQAYFDHATQISARNRRRPPPGSTPANNGPSSGHIDMHGGYPVYTREQALAASKVPGNKGKHFYLQGSPDKQEFH